MIEIKNVEIAGFETAIRGMRNPLKSWDKSDSKIKGGAFELGPNDLDLAKRLAAAGQDHGKFLRQIYVGVDINAPFYWWKEMDQYKVSTATNSESTMHRLSKDPITVERFSIDEETINLPIDGAYTVGDLWIDISTNLELMRLKYLFDGKEEYWRALNQLLPQGWMQMRTWTGNYSVLKNIYHARKHHRLSEWHDFCKWIEGLPYAKELIIGE